MPNRILEGIHEALAFVQGAGTANVTLFCKTCKKPIHHTEMTFEDYQKATDSEIKCEECERAEHDGRTHH
jgi:hypothetical protein